MPNQAALSPSPTSCLIDAVDQTQLLSYTDKESIIFHKSQQSRGCKILLGDLLRAENKLVGSHALRYVIQHRLFNYTSKKNQATLVHSKIADANLCT